MTGTTRAGGYRTLFARPRVTRTFALAAIGRAGYAMLPLLLLFTVSQAAGSFRLAAVTMSCYGFTTLLMPLKSRSIDRHGTRIILPVLGIGFLAALAAMMVAAAAGVRSVGCWLPLGMTVGLFSPPLGPVMRAQWRSFAGDQLTLAFALDAVTEEGLWLLGPVLSGGLLAFGPAWHGVLLPGALVLVGCVGLAFSPAARTANSTNAFRTSHAGRTALRHTALWPVLTLMLSYGAAGALLSTGVAAMAAGRHTPGFAGIAEAAIAVGAIAGGLLWGRRASPRPWAGSAAPLLAAWAALVIASGAAGVGLPMLGTLTLAGAVGAPLWPIVYLAAEQLVAKSVRTEANTWVTTVYNLGSTIGTTAAGALAATALRLPFVAAAAIAAAAGCCLHAVARKVG